MVANRWRTDSGICSIRLARQGKRTDPRINQSIGRLLPLLLTGLLLLGFLRNCDAQGVTNSAVSWKGVLNSGNTVTLESFSKILATRSLRTVECAHKECLDPFHRFPISSDASRTNAQTVDFANSNLDDLVFVNANFNHALLTNASLSKSRLLGADFYHADLSHCSAFHADFGAAPSTKLARLSYLAHWFPEPDPTAWDDFDRSNFRGAKLISSRLSGSIFDRTDCRGADFSGADLTDAVFRSALLDDAILADANLAGANFSHAVFVNASLERVRGWTRRILRRSSFSEFWEADYADFSHALFVGAKLKQADLRGCSFVGASFEDADLTECQFWSADLEGVLFEPKLGCLPDLPSLATARSLATLRFKYSSSALASVRNWFREAGLQRQDREITFAINRSRYLLLVDSKGSKRLDGWFRFVCFEMTCAYGMSPWRPLVLVALLVPVFAIPYTASVFLSGRSGILASRPPDFSRASKKKPAIIRILSERSLGNLDRTGPLQAIASRLAFAALAFQRTYAAWLKGAPTMKIINRFCYDVFRKPSKSRLADKVTRNRYVRLRRVDFAARAVLVGTYFSILSGTRIGFREFNIGNWLTGLQCREYALHGVGWVRFLVGVQSLLSVYLLALWVLSYFGHPFD